MRLRFWFGQHVLSLIYGAVIEEAWVKGRLADAIPAGAKDFYAYRNLWTACLFTGPGFPQIDPETEAKAARRSEEHTSELQSLMRSSYAVFCLKKQQIKERTSRNRNKTHV